jgi:predicted DNA-binding protein (MmcQ/YjbR family)
MNIEEIQKYCNTKNGVTEGFPFDDTTLVFKVANKIFCLASLKPPLSINLKCDPEKAIELREQFEEVIPGYHMNKQHWNTIKLDGILRNSQIEEWIDDSYNLIVSSLPKKIKNNLISNI